MIKTEAERRAREQVRYGYFRLSDTEVEIRCPLCRAHLPTSVVAWATERERVAAARERLVEHLQDEH